MTAIPIDMLYSRLLMKCRRSNLHAAVHGKVSTCQPSRRSVAHRKFETGLPFLAYLTPRGWTYR